jgi:hypothetical protein
MDYGRHKQITSNRDEVSMNKQKEVKSKTRTLKYESRNVTKLVNLMMQW